MLYISYKLHLNFDKMIFCVMVAPIVHVYMYV